MKIQQILLLLISFLAGAMVYAMDWQREQDEKISGIDKLIMRQTTLMEMQVRYNERAVIQNSDGGEDEYYLDATLPNTRDEK